MTGKWRVRDADWPTPRNTWLIIRHADKLVAQINGPVLELMTASRTRFDQRIAGLGPDILAPELDEEAFLRRLRTDDPTRAIGDALLDQRTIAGLGTVWRTLACWAARIDPHRPTRAVSDEELLTAVRDIGPRMALSARTGTEARDRACYGLRGRPCRRCGAKIRSGHLGDDNRPVYWCPGCQS
jgi:endonuclease-8